MPSLKQNSDGSLGIETPGGTSSASGEFINVTIPYNASSVDVVSFVASRPYRVASIMGRPQVIGSDASAVTAVIKKAPSATGIASGTALHSSTYDLKGTAATNQTLTLSTTASDLIIATGDAVGVDFTGVLTAAVGVITVALCPA